MKQADQVAPQSAATINIAFRPDTLDKVGKKVSRSQPERIGKRHVAFANNVGRIDNLRVSKSNLAALAALGAKVNSPHEIRPHDPAGAAQRSAEIQVFLPAIQRQALVKP